MEKVINAVLGQMVELDSNERMKLEAVLRNVLSDYTLTQNCTALATESNEWLEMLDLFIARKITDGKSKRTTELYHNQLIRVLSYLNKPCNEITENDLFKYLAAYKQTRGVSNRYLDDQRRIMSSFFGWLSRKGFIDSNPAQGLDTIKFDSKIQKPFTDEELELLKQHCKSTRELALIEVLYSTGVRVSELVSLNRSDINLDTLEVVVVGKGNKERITYLSKTARLHLKEYLAQRTDNNAALFVTEYEPHERLGVASIQRLLKKIGKKAGVADTHPHRFRRTMATNILKKGMPLEEVSKLLGHSKLETTMIYCTVNQENVRHSHSKYMCA